MSQFDNILDKNKKEKKRSAFDSILEEEPVEEKVEVKKMVPVKTELNHDEIDEAIKKNGKRPVAPVTPVEEETIDEDLDEETTDENETESDLDEPDPEEKKPERQQLKRRPPPQRRPGLLGRWRNKSKQKIIDQKRRMHSQDPHKQPPKKKIEKPDAERQFTREEQQLIQAKFAREHKMSRKDRKKLKHKELQPNYQKAIITIFTISIFFFFLMFQYNPGNEAIMTIMLLIGCILFLPIGMIIGWMIMDPFMRCKIMRKMTKRNWGVINFVAKGKKIVSRIKNLDNDLIWIKNKCWAVTKEGIYELDKNGDRIIDEENRTIDADSIVTITETVPVMFIDMNSMQPLTFQYDGREGISPAELGSSLKGWVDNQLAKVMFLKRTMDTYFLIVIICALVSAFYGYTNNSTLQDMQVEIQSLKQMIADLSALSPIIP